ncbi:hypothetical protein J6G99_03975 [bacterium]|nr:hypothetical protein [bacterium]
MELLKIFFKDEVPAVGLNPFRDEKDETKNEAVYFNKQIFKPNYGNNFFLL